MRTRGAPACVRQAPARLLQELPASSEGGDAGVDCELLLSNSMTRREQEADDAPRRDTHRACFPVSRPRIAGREALCGRFAATDELGHSAIGVCITISWLTSARIPSSLERDPQRQCVVGRVDVRSGINDRSAGTRGHWRSFTSPSSAWLGTARGRRARGMRAGAARG